MNLSSGFSSSSVHESISEVETPDPDDCDVNEVSKVPERSTQRDPELKSWTVIFESSFDGVFEVEAISARGGFRAPKGNSDFPAWCYKGAAAGREGG